MKEPQLNLQFTAPAPRGPSHAHTIPRRATTTGTRQAAAADNAPRRLSQREVVYQYIASRGAQGATRKEIAEATGLSENSVRPRIAELARQYDNAGSRPQVYETGLPEDVRDGCSVLFAGPHAIDAERRFWRSRGPDALAAFEAALSRAA